MSWASRRLHFVGIGGAGMSGLALVCHELGADVSGSDRTDSSYMERLRAAGIEPVLGHDAANLPGDAEVVVSTAIDKDNPERALARERGQAIRHRGELLAELCAQPGKRLIAVAGTHGKTTTSAMLAWALRVLDKDPAFFIGGEVPGLGPGGAAANAGWGEGEWVVAEADESDGSFERLSPEIAVVTNVEMEHHAHWGGCSKRLFAAFTRFVGAADKVVAPRGSTFPVGLRQAYKQAQEILYGFPPARVGRYDLDFPGPADLDLAVSGEHNVLNARAALAAIDLIGDLDLSAAAQALSEFPGVKRRQELKGTCRGSAVYDDYAHHPTEVGAALAALRQKAALPIVAVFQPHLYSRTNEMATGFGEALASADEVLVLDIYPARELPVGELAGVSGELVAKATRAAHRDPGRVRYVETAEGALEALDEIVDGSQLVVTLGAGDVTRIADALVATGEGDGG